MIAFKPVKTLLSLHKLECDECGKSVDVTIDERNGDAATQLAQLEPYERAALARQGCPHAGTGRVEGDGARAGVTARLRRTAARVAEATRIVFVVVSEAWKMARRPR